MPKGCAINITISREMKEKIREYADAECRSMSNYIANLIAEDIKRRDAEGAKESNNG